MRVSDYELEDSEIDMLQINHKGEIGSCLKVYLMINHRNQQN